MLKRSPKWDTQKIPLKLKFEKRWQSITLLGFRFISGDNVKLHFHQPGESFSIVIQISPSSNNNSRVILKKEEKKFVSSAGLKLPPPNAVGSIVVVVVIKKSLVGVDPKPVPRFYWNPSEFMPLMNGAERAKLYSYIPT